LRESSYCDRTSSKPSEGKEKKGEKGGKRGGRKFDTALIFWSISNLQRSSEEGEKREEGGKGKKAKSSS